MAVKPIPEGHNTVSPYLIIEGATRVIELMARAFGGQEIFRMSRPDGRIAHAEVRIGDSVVMLADAGAEFPAMPATIHLYLADVDAAHARAVAAGAVSIREPANQFYGDRSAGVRDAGGNQWWISTHVEDVSGEEMARRAEAAMKAPAQQA